MVVSSCVFCEKIEEGGVEVLTDDNGSDRGNGVYYFTPLNPVVDGHKLFVHKSHSKDAAEWPYLTATVFEIASVYALRQGQPFNLITSAGVEATQSIFHLHVHYIPRKENDGLHLPWTGQTKKEN